MIKLSNLTYQHFESIYAWKVSEDTFDEIDISLEPATFDKFGRIQRNNGEVWCLCKAIFFNGEVHKASAMCRGDSNEGPSLLTVFNEVEDVSLLLPPAPDFVLESEGPHVFCQKFKLHPTEVFPLTFKVIPKFEVEPEERYSVIKL